MNEALDYLNQVNFLWFLLNVLVVVLILGGLVLVALGFFRLKG